mgnify:CR=1 FL=1
MYSRSLERKSYQAFCPNTRQKHLLKTKCLVIFSLQATAVHRCEATVMALKIGLGKIEFFTAYYLSTYIHYYLLVPMEYIILRVFFFIAK